MTRQVSDKVGIALQRLRSLSYDPLGRLVGDTNALGDFSYSYLGATGQVQTQSLSGSGYSYATNYHYLSNTDDRRLKAIDNVISNSIGNPPQQPQSFGYATNSEGLATSREVTRGSTSEGKFVYYYDNDSRLTSVYENNALVHAYAYDAVGNMLSVTGVGGQITYQATYNALNEIQTANGVSYSYNAAGELTADGTHTYTWDAAHRLASETDTATDTTTYYHHDGLGRLWEIAQQTKGGTPQVVSEYLWCGQSLCEARQPNGPTNQPLTRYFAQGEQQGSQSLLYARDRLGSVSDLIAGSDASIAASYSYGPWGNVTSQSGSTQTSFGYAGMFNGPETGLNLTLYRAYNPAQYRWLSRDPLGEIVDYNLYRYVADDPLNSIDPAGLWSISFGAFFGIGGRISFGRNPDGSWFFGGNVGIGVGVSGGYDPNGTTPGYKCGATNTYSTIVDSVDIEARALSPTYHVSDKSTDSIVPPISASGDEATGWSPWQLDYGLGAGLGADPVDIGATASVGGYATFGTDSHATCGCN